MGSQRATSNARGLTYTRRIPSSRWWFGRQRQHGIRAFVVDARATAIPGGPSSPWNLHTSSKRRNRGDATMVSPSFSTPCSRK